MQANSSKSEISPTLNFSRFSFKSETQLLGSLENIEPNDIKVLKRLEGENGTNLLVFSISKNKNFIMKVFKYNNNEISESYLHEKRLAKLQHPNVLSISSAVESQKVYHRNSQFYISYLLTEIPRGDFADILKYDDFSNNEKLVRTYFYDLIYGLDYLHTQGIYHCNLNLENLVVGEDFELKIQNFKKCFTQGDEKVRTRGTKHFRAPEMIAGTCVKPELTDVYSAGIILFGLRTGYLPYFEDQMIRDYDLFQILKTDTERFWKIHENINPVIKTLSQDFKNLFCSMVHPDPEKRASLESVRQNKWFNDEILKQEELAKIMIDFY